MMLDSAGARACGDDRQAQGPDQVLTQGMKHRAPVHGEGTYLFRFTFQGVLELASMDRPSNSRCNATGAPGSAGLVPDGDFAEHWHHHLTQGKQSVHEAPHRRDPPHSR